MEMHETKTGQNTLWWITSLAISVVCCAVLFVVFASYLFDIKESVAILKDRYDIVSHRMDMMNMEVENLRRRNTVQQIQILPAMNGGGMGAQPVVIPNSDAQGGVTVLPAAPSVPAMPPAAGPNSGQAPVPSGTPAEQVPANAPQVSLPSMGAPSDKH